MTASAGLLLLRNGDGGEEGGFGGSGIGRMMGGCGSGRPTGSGRTKVEDCRSIDVNHLHREGCLRAGWIGSWQWSRDGKKVAWIDLRAEHDRLHLIFGVRVGGGA